jgi:membrane-bound ClpP family serine protease
VRVAVQGSLRLFDAVSADKKKIATGESIKVLKAISNSLLVVEKLEHKH